jgi:hypothetical protein
MGDRISGKAWRIMHPYHRRPLSAFATTIAAVIALHFCLLAARRAGGTRPPGPGSGRVGPVVSAQRGDLVKLSMADEPKPRRRRRKMLVLLGVGVGAWLVRYRIRERHGLDNKWQHLPAAPQPAPGATPASAAADTAQPSSSPPSPNPVTPEPAQPTAGPVIGPVTAVPLVRAPAPRGTPAPEAAAGPEPVAPSDEPVKPAAANPAPPQPNAVEPAPPTSGTTQPAPPTPAPDQPADAQHPTRSGAVPAASAHAAVTTAARADAPFGPGSVRARSDGSSPDPAYVVKGKTATKAFYTPAAAYYTRTRADVWFRTADDARAALERWFRRAARDVMVPKLDAAAAALGRPYARLSVRGQRTRWGSCSSTGALSFNWRLLLAPEPVLDYVVWHEACHLLVMDHSPRFWRLLESHLPAYREPRRWLRANGAALILP